MFGLPLLSTVTLSSLLIAKTNAHGYSSEPIARQVKCNEDGGYWWEPENNIPNKGCRGAYFASVNEGQQGTYQFQQINEYAANVHGYGDIENVKKVIQDGTLCAAGDHKKYGMDFVSGDWHKNTIHIDHKGIFHTTVKYCAIAVHNPSYWEVYITKEGFNSGDSKLTWDDLTFIKKIENIPPKDGKIEHCSASKYYEFEIDNAYEPLSGPVDNAIIYLRWQREDSGNEGFYNCLDVNFVKDEIVDDKGRHLTVEQTKALDALFKSFNVELPVEKDNNLAQEAHLVHPAPVDQANDNEISNEIPTAYTENEINVSGASTGHVADEL